MDMDETTGTRPCNLRKEEYDKTDHVIKVATTKVLNGTILLQNMHSITVHMHNDMVSC